MVVLLRIEVLALDVAAGLARGFAYAVEVVALGAVFPVVALGGAEIGAVHAGRVIAAFGARLGGRVGALGVALGHPFGRG